LIARNMVNSIKEKKEAGLASFGEIEDYVEHLA
jgi:hypothetical protein